VNAQTHSNESTTHVARQFSVRELLAITLFVAIILMIGVLARGTERFKALSTAWTTASLLPVLAVLAAYRWRLVSPRTLVFVSILSYVAALCLPYIGGGDEIEFGAQSALMSFVGLQFLWDPYVRSSILIGGVPVPTPFLTYTVETSLIITCVLGATANLAYFVGVASYWFARKRRRAFTWSRRAAIIATSLAVAAIVML
jgi:hypothetical protein